MCLYRCVCQGEREIRGERIREEGERLEEREEERDNKRRGRGERERFYWMFDFDGFWICRKRKTRRRLERRS